jgi:probable HAF family extracellular repeat protein
MKRYGCFLIALVLAACGGGGGSGGHLNATPVLPPSSASGASTPQPAAVPKFTVVDLGANVVPTAVNSAGTVVGFVLRPSGTSAYSYAFSYYNGVLHNLGTLPGDTSSYAADINDDGTIVGSSSNATAGSAATVVHAALFTNSSVSNLGGLSSNTFNFATAISNSGTIVGHSDDGGSPSSGTACYGSAVTFDGHGGAQALSALGSAIPYAVNDAGNIVGAACTSGTANRTTPFHYPPFALMTVNTSEANQCLSPFVSNRASDVNTFGHVIGTYNLYTSCVYHGFLYINGVYTDIPGSGSNGGNVSTSVSGLNDSDWVVGDTAGSSQVALLYVSGTSYDLNTLLTGAGCSLWTLRDAADVNNSGVIVGTGQLNGQDHGFMLVPQR